MNIKERIPNNAISFFIIMIVSFFLSSCGLLKEDKSSFKGVFIDIAGSTYTNKAILVLNENGNALGTTLKVGQLPNIEPMLKSASYDFNEAPQQINVIEPWSDMHAHADNLYIKQIPKKKTNSITTSTHTKTFLTNILRTPKTVVADKVYSSTKCDIYLEQNFSKVVDWTSIGQTFDNTIDPKIKTLFGNPLDINNDGKVTILYYEIQGNESPTQSIAGYVTSIDFFSNDIYPYSNEMDLIYMDATYANTYPAGSIRTLAHEYQHLVNFSYRLCPSGGFPCPGNERLPYQDAWINEGLSESSEHHVFDSPLTGAINYFVFDPTNKLRQGLSLTTWEGSYENYIQAYLFMEYARVQSGLGTSLYQTIQHHSKGDYKIFDSIISNQENAFESFEDILRGFRLAILMQEPTGIYGYKDESSTFDFGNLWQPSNSSDRELGAGAAIYIFPSNSDLKNFEPGDNADENLTFIRLNNS